MHRLVVPEYLRREPHGEADGEADGEAHAETDRATYGEAHGNHAEIDRWRSKQK